MFSSSPAKTALPVTGIGNLQQQPNGVEVASGDSFAEGTSQEGVYGDFRLFDTTTGAIAQSAQSWDRDFQLGFQDLFSAISLALPESRQGHLFSVGSSSWLAPLSSTPNVGHQVTDANGQTTLVLDGFFEAYGLSTSGYLIDHTTKEVTPFASGDGNLLGASWAPLQGATAAHVLTIWLGSAEANSTFLLHTSAGTLEWLRPKWMTFLTSAGSRTGYTISALVGPGHLFWLERQQDGATAPGQWTSQNDETYDFSNFFVPLNPLPGPPAANFIPQDDRLPLRIVLPASRWRDQLELHTSSGDVVPLQPRALLGHWGSTSGKNFFFANPSPAVFIALTEARLDSAWWIVDVTTGEESAPETHDLTSWRNTASWQDSDGDGLLDWQESLFGTSATVACSLGDGINDGWKVNHGLDPLAVHNYQQVDPYGSGYTYWQEYQMESGAIPWIPNMTVSVAIDPTRAGHAFSLNPLGESVTSSLEADTSGNLRAIVTLRIDTQHLDLAALRDDSSGDQLFSQDFSFSLGSTTDATSGVWYNVSSGLPTDHRFLLLPASQQTDTFFLFSGGSFYPVSIVSSAAPIDLNGELLISAVGYLDIADFQLVDATAHTTAGLNQKVVRSWDLTWWNPIGGYPWCSATIMVSDGDAGQSFLLTSGSSSSWLAGEWDTINGEPHVVVHATLPIYAPFSLTRQNDTIGVQDAASAEANQLFDHRPDFPPRNWHPDFQQVAILVGSDHWYDNITATQWDGSVVNFYWSMFQKYLDTYDEHGSKIASFPYMVFYGYVDINQSYWLTNSNIKSDLISGSRPPYSGLPNQFFVGENHWNESIQGVDSSGSIHYPSDTGHGGVQVVPGPYGEISTYRYKIWAWDTTAPLTIQSSSGTTNFMDGWEALAQSPPPHTYNYQWVSVKVGQDHYGQAVFVMADGTTRIADSIGTETTEIIQSENGAGFYAAYRSQDESCYLDVNSLIAIQNSANPLQPLYNPPSPGTPPASSIGSGLQMVEIQLPRQRLDDQFEIVFDDGTTGLFTLDPNLAASYQLDHTIFVETPDQQHVVETVEYILHYIVCTGDQGFTIRDTARNDSTYYWVGSYGSTQRLSLERWYFQAPLQFEVAISRWFHELAIHTSSGAFFPVTKGTIQGYWNPFLPDGSYVSSYFFDASSVLEGENDWWLYDATTGEHIDKYNTQQSQASDSSVDTDGDGLPDYIELLGGTNPANADTDGDGIPDGWELAHGLNPNDSSDANTYFAPGITWIAEYLHEIGAINGGGASPIEGDWIPTASLTLFIEAGRSGHSLAFQYGNSVVPAYGVLLSNYYYAAGTGSVVRWIDPRHFYECALLDLTNGDRLPFSVIPNAFVSGPGTYEIDATSAPWYADTGGEYGWYPSTKRSYLLPAWRRDHAIFLYDENGNLHPTNWTDYTGQVFQWGSGFVPSDQAELITDCPVGLSSCLVDLTTGQATSMMPLAMYLEDVQDSSGWTGGANINFYSQKLILPQGDVGQQYCLIAGSLIQWLTPQWEFIDGQWYTTVTISLPLGVAFSLRRMIDGFVVQEATGTLPDQVFDLRSSLPPLNGGANWQTLFFPVSINHLGSVVVVENDGSVFYPQQTGNQWLLRKVDNQQTTEEYVWEYSAAVDISQAYWIIDQATGEENLLPQCFVTSPAGLLVGENHWDEPLSIASGWDGHVVSSWDSGETHEIALYQSSDLSNPAYIFRYKVYGTTLQPGEPFSISGYSDPSQLMDGFAWPAFSPAPYTPVYGDLTVRVGEDHYGEAVLLMSDGTQIVPDPVPWSESSQPIYDSAGQLFAVYRYRTYWVTYVDTRSALGFVNAAYPGHPLYSPPLPGVSTYTTGTGGSLVTMTISASRADHLLRLQLEDGTYGEFSLQWPNQPLSASLPRQIYVGSPDARTVYNELNYYVVSFQLPHSDVSAGYVLLDLTTNESRSISGGLGVVDLSGWETLQPLQLSISNTRWAHTLSIHTSDEQSFPVVRGSTQGVWTVDQINTGFTSAWYFTATSNFLSGFTWWLFDETTGEVLPDGQNDTTSIPASDANVDTDHDGLPDWVEKISGTNIHSVDSDGDGLSDGFELSHGLNPKDPTDATEQALATMMLEMQQGIRTIPVDSPIDLKVLKDGRLFVLSRATATLTEFGPNGSVNHTYAGLGSEPSGFDIDSQGRVLIADTGSNCIRRVLLAGDNFSYDVTFGVDGSVGRTDHQSGSEGGELNQPYDVAVDPISGAIYVSDTGNSRIQKLSSSGMFLDEIGSLGNELGEFKVPTGLTFGTDGKLYIADPGKHSIVVISGDDVDEEFGPEVESPYHLGQPRSVLANALGIFVSDSDVGCLTSFRMSAESGLEDYERFSPEWRIHSPALVGNVTAIAGSTGRNQEKLYAADLNGNSVHIFAVPRESPLVTWNKFLQSCTQLNAVASLECFDDKVRQSYANVIDYLGMPQFRAWVTELGPLELAEASQDCVTYRGEITAGGVQVSFNICFVKVGSHWKILEL